MFDCSLLAVSCKTSWQTGQGVLLFRCQRYITMVLPLKRMFSSAAVRMRHAAIVSAHPPALLILPAHFRMMVWKGDLSVASPEDWPNSKTLEALSLILTQTPALRPALRAACWALAMKSAPQLWTT